MADRELTSAPGKAPVSGDQSAFAHAVLECSPDCLKVLDTAGNVLFFNANGLCAMEIDDMAQVAGQYWPSFWPAETSDLARQAVSAALAGEVGSFEGFCPTAKGTPKYWDVSVTAVPNPGQPVERLLVLSRDITSRREKEARDAALAAELAHRINNTLSVVMVIASQTKRATTDIDGFYGAFSARLKAMSDATNAVVANDWNGADLRALASTQLNQFRGDVGRIMLDGPNTLIPRDAAQPLALVLHELATNAAKYGALSSDDGRVALIWTKAATGDALIVEWRESGGPPVRQPTRTGLGSALIKNGISGADVQLDFAANGLVCRMTLPL